MKAISKKYIFLAAMLLSILGVILVNIWGVYDVFVLSDSSKFVSGFISTFILLLFAFPLLGYEGLRTSTNMLINGLFYVFLIAAIVFFVLFLRGLGRRKTKRQIYERTGQDERR